MLGFYEKGVALVNAWLASLHNVLLVYEIKTFSRSDLGFCGLLWIRIPTVVNRYYSAYYLASPVLIGIAA